jgi:hypothetical protein
MVRFDLVWLHAVASAMINMSFGSLRPITKLCSVIATGVNGRLTPVPVENQTLLYYALAEVSPSGTAADLKRTRPGWKQGTSAALTGRVDGR